MIAAPVTFATLLRRYRTEAGLTQEALAERAGLSARTISDLERGLKRAPHHATVDLLGAALHLSPREQAAFAAAARPGDTVDPPRPAPPSPVRRPTPSARRPGG